MGNIKNILNNNDFFGNFVDTPKEGIEQHKKRECLKSAIGSGKAYLLGSKWTQEKVNRASNEIINKVYVNTGHANWTKRVKVLERP